MLAAACSKGSIPWFYLIYCSNVLLVLLELQIYMFCVPHSLQLYSQFLASIRRNISSNLWCTADCFQCRTPVLEKASKAVWELILDNGGLGKEITETVEKVFCRLSGMDMMPPPPSAAGADQEKDDMAIDEGEKSKEMDSSEPSSSRKRPFSDINRKGAGAVPNGSATEQHYESEDSDQKMWCWSVM